MMLPIAHAGHWLASLLYIVPIVIVVVGLGWQVWREKRRAAAEGDTETLDSPPAVQPPV